MRDFRDAKVMARALRDGLKAKGVETSHSESLELIATAFGCGNWNVLSAKIEATMGPANEARSSPAQDDPAPPKTLCCSFCGKSKQEVRKLIAGPQTCICDECVNLCTDIMAPDDDEELFRLLKENEGPEAYPALLEFARRKSTEELAHYVERSKIGVERHRGGLDFVRRTLAKLESGVEDAEISAIPAQMRDKESLVAQQKDRERDMKRYEDALNIAMTALGERRQ